MAKPQPRVTITLLPEGEEVHGTGLFQLGEREIFIDLGAMGGRLLYLGAAETSHLRVEDPYVSGRQVMLVYEHGCWSVTAWPDARNPTYLDGNILEGTAFLMRGSVLRAGCSVWIVTAEAPRAGEICLHAHNLVEFCVAAYRVYGTTRRAAGAIGMTDRTFRRRLARSEEGRQLLAERRPQPRKRHSCDPRGVPVVPGGDTSSELTTGLRPTQGG
jgi:ribosomal protein L34